MIISPRLGLSLDGISIYKGRITEKRKHEKPDWVRSLTLPGNTAGFSFM